MKNPLAWVRILRTLPNLNSHHNEFCLSIRYNNLLGTRKVRRIYCRAYDVPFPTARPLYPPYQHSDGELDLYFRVTESWGMGNPVREFEVKEKTKSMRA